MQRISYLVMLVLLGAILSLCGDSLAGTTGKITGQVTDEAGNPVPGVAVRIEGTRRGTETDVEGIYLLLSVEPGKHGLIASMVGYESQRREDVMVSSDFTTNASFKLKELPVQLGEIVVEAQRGTVQWGMLSMKANTPPVAPDKTTSLYVVRAEDIEALPIVREMAEFIELQAGVAIDETGNVITVRAGDPEDVAYSVDGILLPTTDVEDTRVYRDFNRLSV